MAPAGGADEVGESGGPSKSKRHRVEPSAAGGVDGGQSLRVESGSEKSKDPVISKSWIECLELRFEDSQRITKEIENLKSKLEEDLQQLGYCEDNDKLRGELAMKVKEMHCLMKRIEELEAKNDLLRKRTEELEAINDGLPKRNEELQAKNDDLTKQNKELQARNDCLTKGNEELQAKNDNLHKNIVEILDNQIESKKRHLQQTESWKTKLELSNARLKEEIKLLYEGNIEETCCLMSHPTCSNLLKATLEDEVHNLKARDQDHLKETRDLWKQLHVRDQEVKDFSERCKSLEIELITKSNEIDRFHNDLTAKHQGKALIEKSCAAILESFESKKTAAVKASSDAVKAFRPEKVSLQPGDIQGYFKWMESSFEDLRQAAYLSGYADAMISARTIAYSSFEQKDAQQSGVGIQSVDPHAGGQPDAGGRGNGAPSLDEELAPTCDGGPATAYSRPLNGKA